MENINTIATIILAIINAILIYAVIKTANNTEEINLKLEYLIKKNQENDIAKTLDKIEEELKEK